jgi:hypothetical protein
LTAGLNGDCDRPLGRDPALDLCFANGRIADGPVDDLHPVAKTRWASTSARHNHDAPVAIIGASRNGRSGDGQASRCQCRCLQTNAQPIRARFIRSAEHGDLLGAIKLIALNAKMFDLDQNPPRICVRPRIFWWLKMTKNPVQRPRVSGDRTGLSLDPGFPELIAFQHEYVVL